MRRYGPLIVAEGALVVGDPGRGHLRLTEDVVAHRHGAGAGRVFAWEHLSSVRFDVPTTGFRYPGLASTIGLGILAAAAQEDVGIGPDDGSVELIVRGEAQRLDLGRHHVGGYWRPTVVGAQLLLDQLIGHPEQRLLLGRPEVLVDLAAKLARREAG
ncbi:hypothetical protein [Microbacterium galbinum]|uniref:Transcriptional regulator n=1 Tax=Microbacterium galbinum TaxID=2851646 RepID=A0ABY4ISB1_9MICO|nr:hypothetical protein [Microbacterium galbinum]UPL15524.1 hypothetical protein KV396_14005 [Microbacterium galbinum]